MSQPPNIRDPFPEFLFAHLAEYTRTQLPEGVRMSSRMWLEQVTLAHDAWHGARKKKRVKKEPPGKKPSEMTDEEWIVHLEAEPHLSGIDIRKEIGAAQFWARENHRLPTRPFLVNWLKKAPRTLTANLAGQTTRAVKAAGVEPEPAGWRDQFPDFIDRAKPWAALQPAQRQHIINHMKNLP